MSFKCILEDCDSRNYLYKIYRVFRQLIQKNIGGMPRKVDSSISISSVTSACLSKRVFSNLKVFQLSNPVSVIKRNITPAYDRDDSYLFIGRLSPEKGLDVFCQACTEACVKGIVIGDGFLKREYQEKYPNIKFKGWMKSQEVCDILKKVKVFVFSSQWYETFGLTVHEALAMGTPCLVASNTAPASAIIEGYNGYCFNDQAELVQKIKYIEQNEALLPKLTEQTYQKYWSNPYDIETHTSCLLDIYDEVLR